MDDSKGKQIAFTFDDLPLNGPMLSLKDMRRVNKELTAKLRELHIPATGFVNESKLYDKIGEVDARIALLELWLDRGLDLGNHTFSHPALSKIPLVEYEADVIRGETVTAKLLAAKGKKLEYFRYPFLDDGLSDDVRKTFQSFLTSRGYVIAPITIDPWDWMYSAIYTKAKLRGDRNTMKKVAGAYLEHTATMLTFFEQLALDITGRRIRHIMLMHCNLLNADHIDDVAKLFRAAGYEFIPLSEALKDPVYSLQVYGDGSEGWSWLERLARDKPSGKPTRPETQQFVRDLYKDAHYKN